MKEWAGLESAASCVVAASAVGVDVAYRQVRTFGTANGFCRGSLLEDRLPWVVIDESLPSFQKIPKTA